MTYTKVVLTVIAVLLAALVMLPAPVRADSDFRNLFVDQGTNPLRNLNESVPGDGKVMINMSTGEVWGFRRRGLELRIQLMHWHQQQASSF
jgi:hypothetical protein